MTTNEPRPPMNKFIEVKLGEDIKKYLSRLLAESKNSNVSGEFNFFGGVPVKIHIKHDTPVTLKEAEEQLLKLRDEQLEI